MKIVDLPDHDKAKFDEIAAIHGTVFNTTGWASIFGDKIRFYGIYTDNDRLIGGFILYKERKYGFSVYRNPLFTPAIGPFLKIDAQNPTTIMDTWKEALSLLADFIDKIPYSVVSSSLNLNIIDVQPFIWKKFKVIPGYTYLIDLKQPLDELWQNISKVRKNELKKAAKDSLVVQQTDDYICIKNLVLKTFSRQDKDVNEYYLSKILFEFANKNNSYAFIAYKGDLPIAGTFCVYSNGTAYALVGGYDHEQKHRGAGPSVDWECIKYAHKLGLICFDFEGSMNPRIEKYFRGFGGQLTPYYQINKAKLPLEILLKLYRRDLF
ncbi:GNAT family N-acetyltransferase [candidate division WS5 bacterium]|uniref:GNAT family N-acetyltransferase n=1 Tax=candidate division WS5 bacterium TaxID=2093353 RepID=A0A419DB90_9BACT|nr:MAG: GNAT family N-acetyltransferase [candidate division WS5 bacterium]